MTFNGFQLEDFDVFHIDGLEERMKGIQTRIQPKFKEIGAELEGDLAVTLGKEMFLHIAKHARRTVNPPDDTWMAFSDDKRGYKKHPHFQVGLWDDRLFVWLAFIYELPSKQQIANHFLSHQQKLKEMIPDDYSISMNHMKKSNDLLTDLDWNATLERFRDVKSAELLIGKQFSKTDAIIHDGPKFMEEVKSIFHTLVPIYEFALTS